jgi:hypothetical protein
MNSRANELTGRHASGEYAGEVGNTNGERPIVKAQTGEVETRNSDDVANTWSSLASDHVALLLNR